MDSVEPGGAVMRRFSISRIAVSMKLTMRPEPSFLSICSSVSEN